MSVSTVGDSVLVAGVAGVGGGQGTTGRCLADWVNGLLPAQKSSAALN